MKKIWSIALIIIFIVAIALKLGYNKKQIEAASKIDSAGQIIIPVKVITTEKIQLQNKLSLGGNFISWSDVTVMAESQGKVSRLYVETGKFVKEGDILVQLEDETIRSQMALAEANNQKAERDFSKYSGLAATDAVSHQQLEEVKLALKNAQTNLSILRKQLENTCVKAPFNGVVTKRYIEKGTFLLPGTPVADITELNRVKFIARVSEQDVNFIQPGMRVELEISAIGKDHIVGKVYTVQSKADEAKRFNVEVEIQNQGNQIKPGMFGTMLIAGMQKSEPGLYIPRECLIGSIKEPEVFVVKNNMSMRKSIKIGRVTDDKVEVLDGIGSGELVVVSGQINLDDSTKVSLIK